MVMATVVAAVVRKSVDFWWTVLKGNAMAAKVLFDGK